MASSSKTSQRSSNMTMAASIFLAMLLASIDTTGAQIGVCYGRVGNDLPPPSEVVQLYRQNNIQRMRIYDPNPQVLQALRGSNIGLILDVPNDQLGNVASSQGNADAWVRTNVVAYGDIQFRYIAVGNEVEPNSAEARSLVGAIRNIQNAINSVGLGNRVKVSTAFKYSIMGNTYPPAQSTFNPQFVGLLRPIFDILAANQAPILLNLYPFFSHRDNPDSPTLNYALFNGPADPNTGYENLFFAMLDATYFALEKEGRGSLKIVVSESGWASAEGGPPTTVDNARTYNNNLVQQIKRGTPKRPGPIETYIFAMFDENQKTGDPLERHFGLFSPNKQPKYPMRFD